jgi:hypothetical protein
VSQSKEREAYHKQVQEQVNVFNLYNNDDDDDDDDDNNNNNSIDTTLS